MFFSYEEEINYAHEGCDIDDSMDLVIESYINDYTIFEAVLRRDFMEATGILSEAADDNFLTRMWDKIVEFIEMIKKKILGLYDAFVAKIDEIKKKHSKKIVDDYKKYFNDPGASEFIGDYSISNFKLLNKVIVGGGEISVDLKDILKECSPILANDIPYVDEVTKEKLEAIKDEYENVTLSNVFEDVEKKIWSDDEIKNPFSNDFGGVVGGLQKIILSKTDTVRAIKNSKREFNTSIEKCKKDARKKLGEVRRDRNMDKDDKEEEKSKTQLYLKVMSGLKRVAGSISSFILRQVGKVYKESVRLYKAAGSYIKGKIELKKEREKRAKERESANASYLIDDDYINAVAEAAVFELQLGDL